MEDKYPLRKERGKKHWGKRYTWIKLTDCLYLKKNCILFDTYIMNNKQNEQKKGNESEGQKHKSTKSQT